ncbi:MAG: hypothetical protein K2F61_02380, partial [Muribaculaceae bacterium]|nr:hypothetical protein [Muribaculaceae bacterium]
MKLTDTTALAEKINALTADRHFHEAFSNLHALTEAAMQWDLTEKANDLERTYRYLLQYAMAGTDDPSRRETLQEIAEGIMSVVDQCTRRARIDNNATELYYNTLRYERLQNDTIASLIEQYKTAVSSDAFGDILGKGSTKGSASDTEALARRIFNRIWVTLPLSRADTGAIAEALRSPLLSSDFKTLIISAVMLGAVEFFETSRIIVLIEFYRDSTEKYLKAIALTAAIVAMLNHKSRTAAPIISGIIKETANAEDSTLGNDLRIVLTELSRTRDTERINKKMRDEVMP